MISRVGRSGGAEMAFDGESDADLWCFVFVGFFFKKRNETRATPVEVQKNRRDFFENRKRKRARETESERENGNVTVDAQRIRVGGSVFE